VKLENGKYGLYDLVTNGEFFKCKATVTLAIQCDQHLSNRWRQTDNVYANDWSAALYNKNAYAWQVAWLSTCWVTALTLNSSVCTDNKEA